MSSEMRELMQSVLDFVNRQPCRCMSIAQLGERDYCDRCQSVKNLRAILARTEAGADGGAPICLFDATNPCDGTCGECHHLHASPKDAAPVADGAVAWGVEVDGGFDYVSTIMTSVENEAAFYGPEHTIRIIPLYTHPQDASGNAESTALYVAMLDVQDMATEALAHWDADRDSKVGKMLLAMSGRLPGYDSRADKFHAAMQAKEAK